MRRLAVLLGILGMLAGVTWQIARSIAAPPDPLERKLAEAKRFLYYVVTPTQGPEFRLLGDERELHIITHAYLPGPAPYDPTRQIIYGLRLSVVDGGAEIWQHDVYTRSRQSKGSQQGGLWLEENSFTLEPSTQVTDDRLIAVRLPTEARAGTSLRLRLIGPVSEGLVRVYERTERPNARLEFRLRSLAPAQRDELAQQLSFTPWDRLEPAERVGRLRFQGLRLPADGREGENYETRALYVTGFRVPVDEETPIPGTLVTAQRGAAVNVVGPIEVKLHVARATGLSPDVVPAALTVRSVGEGGQPPPLVLSVPPAPAAVTQTLTIPPGLHSLQLFTDARDGVRVVLSAPAGAHAQLGPPRPSNSPEELLQPDEVLLPGYLLDEKSAAVDLAVAGPDDLLTRIFRVDARLLPTPAAPGSPAAGELTVETQDAQGKTLTRQQVKLQSVVSAFEEVRLPQGELRIACEPTGFRLIAPAGARHILVSAAQPTLIRPYTLVTLAPSPDGLEPPYNAVQLQSTLWRYAPYDERSWVPVQARNHPELERLEAKLAAQIRLEPTPPPTPPPGTTAQTLLPEGDPEKQVILERVRPEEMLAFKWTEGYYTAVRPGRPQRIRLVAGPAPKLQYWVLGLPEANLGHEVMVKIDGAAVATQIVTTNRGAWQLPELAPGVHTLELVTDAPNLRLLVDQQPAGGGDMVALRNVYRTQARLAFNVRKPAGNTPSTVNIIVYAASRDADPRTQYRVTIDGGAPRHLEGVALAHFSPGSQIQPLPAADREPILGFADTGDRTAYYPRLIPIGLGDDLAPGPHTLTLEPIGSSGNAGGTWARFFIMTTDKPEVEKAIQWRLAAPSGEGRSDD